MGKYRRRMLRVASALSVLVVLGCAIWAQRLSVNTGPDYSVDFQPLAPERYSPSTFHSVGSWATISMPGYGLNASR